MKLFISFIILFIFCSLTCKKDKYDCHFTRSFKNETNKKIYFETSDRYPDTVIRNGLQNPVKTPELNAVLPFSDNTYKRKSCIEAIYLHSIPSDTMMVYVFDAVVLENTDWETVKANNMYLQRYDLSLEDWKKLNFSIPFPATEVMRNMKMYPKFKQ